MAGQIWIRGPTLLVIGLFHKCNSYVIEIGIAVIFIIYMWNMLHFKYILGNLCRK